MRLLCDYVVPCALCEEPLEHVGIHRDDVHGAEHVVRQRLPHRCKDMDQLLKERARVSGGF